MIKLKLNNEYFSEEGHLNDIIVAQYVEALILEKANTLPDSVLEHVEECLQCKMRILELFEILKDREEIKNQKQFRSPPKSKILLISWMKMAAVFLGFMVVAGSVYYLFLKPSKNYQQLFAQHFDPYIDVITVRGDATSAYDTLFYAVLTDYYNKGDFNTAGLLFEKLYNLKASNDSLLFYYGVSCLAAGEYSKAILLFDELAFFEKSIFYDQSRWYLALAYLDAAAHSNDEIQQKMLSKSKKLLQEIVDQKKDFETKAKALLLKI